MERWPVDADRAAGLKGTQQELEALLRDTLDLSTQRAEAEVQEFFDAFHHKMKLATEPAAPAVTVTRPTPYAA